MAGSDLDGRRLKPAITVARTDKWRVVPSAAAVAKYATLKTDASVGRAYAGVSNASADVLASSRGLLLLALHAVGSEGTASPSLLASPRVLVIDQDTSGTAIGDPVYLNTNGGVSFSTPTDALQRSVGVIVSVSATTGAWLFDGTPPADGPLVVGTVTVANGQTTGSASVGAIFNGRPVMATLNTVDGVKRVVAAVVAGGTLTITMSAAVAADRPVAYAIF